MKKYVLLICAAAVLLAACEKKAESGAVSAKTTVKIGATLPLSGDSAIAGQAAQAGLQMIADEWSAKSAKYNYQLVVENNEGKSGKTATTTHKLINVDKVSAVFSLWNYMGSVVAGISNPKKVINMTCSWEEPSLVGAYTFNAISTNEQIAGLLVDTLKEQGVRSAATLVDNSGESIIKLVEDKMHAAGIDVVFKEIVNFGNNDYKMAIIKANRLNPDMYVIVGAPPMPFIFVKQLAEITGKKNVTGIDGFMEMTEAQRPIANGLWYVDSNVNGNKEFARRLQEKYHVETQSCAGNLVAALQVLINAYENVETAEGRLPESAELAAYMQKNVKDFATVSGSATLIRDNIINIKPVVRWVRDGKIVEE